MSSSIHPNRAHNFFPWTIQATQDRVVEIAGGDGVYFWDSKKKRYLDFVSQLFNLNLGHGNPALIRAIQQQAATLCAASSMVMHEGRTRLGDQLAEITPGDLCKAFFTNSGSEANEIALEMARMVTGRQKVLAKYRSYHGTTMGTLTVCGDPRRMAVEPGPPGAVRFFDPFCYRCDFNLAYPDCALHCADALERQIRMEGPDSVAALILEPFTAAAGGFPVPPGYLRRVREICDKHRIVMIADEVICGFGRTGEWFAVDHEDVVPDILTVAKGITSAYVPLGAAIVNQSIADHFERQMLPIGCTYTAHPLACAAGLAAIEQYKSLGAIQNSKKMGEVLAAELKAIKKRHPIVGDVRSQGLLGCVELVRDRTTREPIVEFNTAPPLVDAIKARFVEQGLYVYVRWNLILLAPPLIIEEQDLRKGLAIVDEVVAWVTSQ
jgi:taurine--2-oxoglutarate transaminase